MSNSPPSNMQCLRLAQGTPNASSQVVVVVVLLCTPLLAQCIVRLLDPIHLDRVAVVVLRSPVVAALVRWVDVAWQHSPIESR